VGAAGSGNGGSDILLFLLFLRMLRLLLGPLFLSHQIIIMNLARWNATALGTFRQQFRRLEKVVSQGFDSGFLTTERTMI